MSASSSVSWSRYGAVHSAPVEAEAEGDGNGNGNGEAEPATVTATAAEAGVAFFSRAKALAGAARRPWREVFDASAFAVPGSCGEARVRARRNLAYFRANYVLAALVAVFLGLILRPVSMLVFLALFAAWLLLYFGRGGGDAPPVCLGREVDDRVVLAALSAATALALVLANAGLNLLISLAVAAALIGAHAAFRLNLYVDEREITDGGIPSLTGSSYTLPR